jgi:hypothetical protein
MFKIVCSILVHGLLYKIVSWFGQEAIDTNNYYSLNHLRYLQLYYGIIIKFYACIFVSILTFNNFGIKFRIYCLDGSLFLILCTFRAVIVGYIIFWMIPALWEFFSMTWTLNSVNWWQDPNERFFTNCSRFNAVLVWLLWFITLICMWLFMFYLTCSICFSLLIYGGRSNLRFIREACKMSTRFVIFKLIAYFILGKRLIGWTSEQN